MKINTSCVLKYLKHDYKEDGKVIAAIAGLIAVCSIVWVICTTGPSVIWPYISSYCTAYNILNVIAGAIVVAFTVGVAVFGNKEWFEYKPWKEGYGWGQNDHEPKGSGVLFFPALAIGFLVYMLYWIEYLLIGTWENPIFSTIIFIALILIGTPIGCAIARCKEE